jgi:hypothetical protein
VSTLKHWRSNAISSLEQLRLARHRQICATVYRSEGRRPKVEGRKGDLSRFVEETVRFYWSEKAVEQANGAAKGMGATELNDLIDEAVQWAREH